MCSFCCYEDLPTCGEGGIRTHGGDQPHVQMPERSLALLFDCLLNKIIPASESIII